MAGVHLLATLEPLKMSMFEKREERLQAKPRERDAIHCGQYEQRSFAKKAENLETALSGTLLSFLLRTVVPRITRGQAKELVRAHLSTPLSISVRSPS